MKRHAWLMLLAFPLGPADVALCQSDIGFVRTADATVTGALLAGGGNTILGPVSSVKTLERPAQVILSRGGLLNVCQSSAVRLQEAQSAPSKSKIRLDPMHYSLERGSMEIRVVFVSTDTITASGTRLSSAAHHDQADMLNLALHVSPNGNTCVENRGDKSPPLNVTDLQGHGSYLLKPGQHAVFVKGVLQEASSLDTFSCGCPSVSSKAPLLTDASHRPETGKTGNPASEAAAFPFPLAESKIAPQPPAPQPEVLDQARIKVASVLEFDSPSAVAELDAAIAPPLMTNAPSQPRDGAKPVSTAPLQDLPPSQNPEVAPASVPSLTGSQPSQWQALVKKVLFSVGHFFKKIFGS